MMTPDQLGEAIYYAWRSAHATHGSSLPFWSELNDNIRGAWRETAKKLQEHVECRLR